MNASSVTGSSSKVNLDWGLGHVHGAPVRGSSWRNVWTKTWFQVLLALIVVISIDSGLARWAQIAHDWSFTLKAVSLLTIGFLFLYGAIGFGPWTAALGSILLRWHPIAVGSGDLAPWNMMALMGVLTLSVFLGRSPHLIYGLILGIVFGILATINLELSLWLAPLTLGLTWYAQQISINMTRPCSLRTVWALGIAILVAPGLSLILKQSEAATKTLSGILDSARTLTTDPVGPLAWFDRDGWLASLQSVLPSSDGGAYPLGYAGVSCLALCLIAVWPSRNFSPLIRQSPYRIGVGILALGLFATSPLSRTVSFQAQMTQLFAAITVERQVDLTAQHLAGIFTLPWALCMLTLFLAIKQCFEPRRTALPGLVGTTLTLIWLTVSTKSLGLERWNDPAELVPAARALFVIGFSVGTILGLVRIARAIHESRLRLIACLAIMGLVIADLRAQASPASLDTLNSTTPRTSTL